MLVKEKRYATSPMMDVHLGGVDGLAENIKDLGPLKPIVALVEMQP